MHRDFTIHPDTAWDGHVCLHWDGFFGLFYSGIYSINGVSDQRYALRAAHGAASPGSAQRDPSEEAGSEQR